MASEPTTLSLPDSDFVNLDGLSHLITRSLTPSSESYQTVKPGIPGSVVASPKLSGPSRASRVNLADDAQALRYMEMATGSAESRVLSYLLDNADSRAQDVGQAAALGMMELNGAYNAITGGHIPVSEETMTSIQSKKLDPNIAYHAGQIVGGLGIMAGMTSLLRGPEMAAAASEALFRHPAVARFLAPSINWGVGSGGAAMVREGVSQVRDGKLDLEKLGKVVLKQTAIGAAGGALTEGFSPGVFRIAGGSAYGFTTAMMDGASPPEAVVNGAVMGLFAGLSTNQITQAQLAGAAKTSVKNFREAMYESAIKNGHAPEAAGPIADKTAADFQNALKTQVSKAKPSLKEFEALSKEIWQKVGEGKIGIAKPETPLPPELPGSQPETPGAPTAPPQTPTTIAPGGAGLAPVGTELPPATPTPPISRAVDFHRDQILPVTRPSIADPETAKQIQDSKMTDAQILKSFYVDSLTGVPDQRFYHSWTVKDFGRHADVPQFTLDIDNFKQINDAHGHDEAGDKVLQAVGDIFKRHGIPLIRKGGEEFAVPMYHGEDPVEIKAKIEGALKELKAKDFTNANTGEKLFSGVTMSGGFGVKTDQASAAVNADQRLYAAKRAGKDQILLDRKMAQRYYEGRGQSNELTGPAFTDVDEARLKPRASPRPGPESQSPEPRRDGIPAPAPAPAAKKSSRQYPVGSVLSQIAPAQEAGRMDIVRFIRKNGRVNPNLAESGDFRELDRIDLLNTKTGKSGDHMLRSAMEAGYLPRGSHITDLVQLVDSQIKSGVKQYPEGDEETPSRPIHHLSLPETERALIELDAFAAGRGRGLTKAEEGIQAELVEHKARLADAEEFRKFDESTKPIYDAAKADEEATSAAPLRPESIEKVSASPPGPGPGWTADAGAMPGEPALTYKNKSAIIEKSDDQGNVLYEAVKNGGQSLGIFSTLEDAKARIEALDKEPQEGSYEDILKAAKSGDDTFSPGGLYRQVNKPRANTVIVKGVRPDGSVEGAYIHKGGLLSPAIFEKSELTPLTVDAKMIGDLHKAYGITPKAEESAPPAVQSPNPAAPLDAKKALDDFVGGAGGYVSASTNLEELKGKLGNFAVIVKDVNGNRARMSVGDFQRLIEQKPFSDRVREVFLNRDSITNVPDKVEAQEGFMEGLKMDAPALPSAEQIGGLHGIEGIKLTNSSTVSKAQQGKFIAMVENKFVRDALRDNGIKEINIQEPYKFSLSEQANYVKGKKIINISADATDPTGSILHELGHAKFEALPKTDQDKLIAYAKTTTDPEMQGYKKLGEWEEIVADSIYKNPEFFKTATRKSIVAPKSEQDPMGEQFLVPGTPDREIPKGGLGPKVEQDTDLLGEFRPDLQEDLPGTGHGGAQASRGGGTIDTFEPAQESQAPGQKLKLSEEVRKIYDKNGIRSGERYTEGEAGLFYPDSKNVRVQALSAISVAAHEGAHALDNKYAIMRTVWTPIGLTAGGKPRYDPAWRKFRKELTEVYAKHYPGGRSDHKLKKRMIEGYATFIQRVLEKPTETREKYPLVWNEVMTRGGRLFNDQVYEYMKDLRGVVDKYQKLDPLQKVAARTTMTFHQDNIKGGFFSLWDKIVTQVFDEVYPIEKLARLAGVQRTAADPSLWVRQYSNSTSIVLNNIKGRNGFWMPRSDGTFIKVDDKNLRNLTEMLQKKSATEDFNDWLVARDQHFGFQLMDELKQMAIAAQKKLQALLKSKAEGNYMFADDIKDMEEARATIDRYKRQADVMAKNGFNREIVQQAYEQHLDRFAEEEKLFDKFTRANMDALRDAGLITPKQYEEISGHKGYAPLKRDIYDEVLGVGDEPMPPSNRSGANRVSSMIGRRGSQLDIVAPMASLMKDHAEIVRKAMKQIIRNKIYAIAGNFPELFQPQKLERSYNPETKITKYPQEKDPNIIMARDTAGERKPLLAAREVKIVLDDLLDFKSVHIMERLLRRASSIFTKGTTGAYPLFAPTNFLVDQITAAGNTRNAFIPLYDPLMQISKALLNSGSAEAKFLETYLAAGGERQTFARWQDLPPDELFQRIYGERQAMEKFLDGVDTLGDVISWPSSKSEILTRAAEYIKSRKAGNPHIVALEDAGRVSAPFHHQGMLGGGSFGKTLVKSIPFFNPGLQVLAQYARSVKNKSTRNRALFVSLAVMAASVASMAYLLAKATQKQKDLYKDLEPQELANYIWLPHPDGKRLIKIRVPQEMNVISTLINMELANLKMNGNYDAGDFVDGASAFLPNQLDFSDPIRQFFSLIPQLVKPAFMVMVGKKDWPKLRDMETTSMKSREPRARYYENTSKFAVWLGDKLNLSPIKIDYLIEGYLGRITRFGTGKDISNPVLREAYFTAGRNMQDYYETRDRVTQRIQTNKDNPGSVPDGEMDTLMEQKAIIAQTDKLLTVYRNFEKQVRAKNLTKDEMEKETEELRRGILDNVDSLRQTKKTYVRGTLK